MRLMMVDINPYKPLKPAINHFRNLGYCYFFRLSNHTYSR